MINGTPVLDIKPFIPQYDYPMTAFGDPQMSSFARPPTEGISGTVEALSNLQVGDNAGRYVDYFILILKNITLNILLQKPLQIFSSISNTVKINSLKQTCIQM